MEIVRDEVIIAVFGDRGQQGGEVVDVAEGAGTDGVEDFGEIGVELEIVGVEVFVTEFFDVFG